MALIPDAVIEPTHLGAGLHIGRMFRVGNRLFIFPGQGQEKVIIVLELCQITGNCIINLFVIGNECLKVRHENEADTIPDEDRKVPDFLDMTGQVFPNIHRSVIQLLAERNVSLNGGEIAGRVSRLETIDGGICLAIGLEKAVDEFFMACLHSFFYCLNDLGMIEISHVYS